MTKQEQAGLALGMASALAAMPEPQSAPAGDALVLMFERLATNPDVDVAKLERLIAMQERILKFNAEAAFNAAFSAMQLEIPAIVESAEGDAGKWAYAPLEDIVQVIRPVLGKHGFSLSHRTVWPDGGSVKVIGILTHRDGHSKESEFQAKADQSGSKNAIQALGSSVSYGKRYTTKDLLLIVTRGEDDNAEGSEPKDVPTEPAGYQDWLADLEACADEGMKAFGPAWNNSKKELREYAVRHDNKKLQAIRAKANKVKKA